MQSELGTTENEDVADSQHVAVGNGCPKKSGVYPPHDRDHLSKACGHDHSLVFGLERAANLSVIVITVELFNGAMWVFELKPLSV